MFVVDSKDNVGTAREIVNYAIETDIDTIQICPLSPFPGTAAYEENKNNLLHTKWNLFDGIHVVVEQQQCSAYDMQLAIVSEIQRFYSLKRVIKGYRPGRGWRVKYRAGGNYLSRKWLKENAEYIEYLRTNAQ
jgi:radical SAM superfamily enzyme YgiQ (UPF0313 family)